MKPWGRIWNKSKMELNSSFTHTLFSLVFKQKHCWVIKRLTRQLSNIITAIALLVSYFYTWSLWSFMPGPSWLVLNAMTQHKIYFHKDHFLADWFNWCLVDKTSKGIFMHVNLRLWYISKISKKNFVICNEQEFTNGTHPQNFIHL